MTDNILKVELYYDKSMDIGFQNIIENKLKKSIDLIGLTKAVDCEKVGEDFKLENKEIENNFINYIRHILGANLNEAIKNIIIKFQTELTMEIYFS